MFRSGGLCLTLPFLAFAQGADTPNDVIFVSGSAIPQQQWVGDTMQVYEPLAQAPQSTYYWGATNAMSISGGIPGYPPGVWGHDEGPSVQLIYPSSDKRLFFLWGDSVTAYNASSFPPTAYQLTLCTSNGSSQSCLGADTVSFIPSSDLNLIAGCSHLQDVDTALQTGVAPPTTYTNCPKMRYVVNESQGGGLVPYAGFTYNKISGSFPNGGDLLLGHTPTGTFALKNANGNSDLFVIYVVETAPGNGSRNFATQSAMFYQNDVNGAGMIGETTMPVLTPGFTFSWNQSHTGTAGNFMYVAPVVLPTSLIGSLGIGGQLPGPLQNIEIVCFWGSSYVYRGSNVHVGCMPADSATIEGSTYTSTPVQGVNRMWYVTGVDAGGTPSWEEGDETLAAGVLNSFNHNGSTTPCVGELSVRWIPALSRFLMTYGSDACGGLWYRTAPRPWGPWSIEAQFFPNDASGGWEQRLVYGPGFVGTPNFNQEPNVYLYEPGGTSPINLAGVAPYNAKGNPYGAYQLPGSQARDNGDGTVNVFMNMSAYNFYVTWQMTAKFQKPTLVRLSGKVKLSPSLTVIR